MMLKLTRARVNTFCFCSVLSLIIYCIAAAPTSAVDIAAAPQVSDTDTGVASFSDCGFAADELELLSRLISAEARGESFDGQVAVGAVVLNRVEHPSFPDSIYEVCYQRGAFSCVDNGQIDMSPTESSRAAAIAALEGDDPSGGAVFFYNPKTAESEWIRTRPVVKVIGNHTFCS